MPRISQLGSLSAPDNADELAIVDVSASITKKITRGDLLKAPLPADSVTTAAIQDGAVTAGKIDFATFTSTPDQTSNITFPSGVTSSDSYLTKISNIAIFTGFFQKSGNFASGDLVATLPAGYRPPAGTFRAAAYSSAGTVNAGRVEISSNGQVIVRNVSAGTIVFQIVFPTL